MGTSSIMVLTIIYLFIPNEVLYGVDGRQIPLQNQEEKTTLQPIDIIIINGKEYSIPNFLQMLQQMPNPPDILTEGSIHTIQKYLSESLTTNIQLTSNGKIMNLSDISRLLGGANITYIIPRTFNISGKIYTIKTLIENFAQELMESIRIDYSNGIEEIYFNGLLIGPQDLINLISSNGGFSRNFAVKNEDSYMQLGTDNFYKTLIQIQNIPDVMLQLEDKFFTIKDFLQVYPSGFTGNIRIFLKNRELGYEEFSKILSNNNNNEDFSVTEAYQSFESNKPIYNNIPYSQFNYNPGWQSKYATNKNSPNIVKRKLNGFESEPNQLIKTLDDYKQVQPPQQLILKNELRTYNLNPNQKKEQMPINYSGALHKLFPSMNLKQKYFNQDEISNLKDGGVLKVTHTTEISTSPQENSYDLVTTINTEPSDVAYNKRKNMNQQATNPETVLVTKEFITEVIYKGRKYTPADILRALSAKNSSDIKILHNSKEYTPEGYLKEFGSSIPCDFSVYKNNEFVDLNEIPNIIDLEANMIPITENSEDLSDMSKIDNNNNIMDILSKNSEDNIWIRYLNKAYKVKDFIQNFKHIPRNFKAVIDKMVIDPKNIRKYLNPNTGKLLKTDTANNFPSIYHNGIIYSPSDILIQLAKQQDNNIQILHENEYYNPVDYINRFNIDFVPKNFQIVYDGQIIKPSHITKLIDLKRIFPELYYKGIKLRPADVINNLAMQKSVPVDVLYQNNIYSPKNFVTMFNEIPDNFDIIVGNIILEPEFVVRKLMVYPGTEKYENPELIQLLEFIKFGSIKGYSVSKNYLRALLEALDIDNVIDLLSQYKELNLQILYENNIFTLEEIRNQFRNLYYPNNFMVIFNGMVIPIRQVFNYFNLRNGYVSNQNNLIVENQDGNLNILIPLLEIGNPDIKILHKGMEYNIKEFLENFGNGQNIDFKVKYGNQILKPEEISKFIIDNYGKIDNTFLPKYDYENTELNNRKKLSMGRDDSGKYFINLKSDVSKNFNSNKVKNWFTNQFIKPKEALNSFKNNDPNVINFFENGPRVEPQEFIQNAYLPPFKPRELIPRMMPIKNYDLTEGNHPNRKIAEREGNIINGNDLQLINDPEYNRYRSNNNDGMVNIIKELSDKPESINVQILYGNQLFNIKEFLEKFKTEIPSDISFIVDNKIVDPKQIIEDYNLSIPSMINVIGSLASNFKIFLNGKEYNPKHFAAIYQPGMNFEIFHNNKAITWENIEKVIRAENTFERSILINGVYCNPMTILMKIVQHLGNSVEFFIFHKGRTYNPEEFFEEFGCAIPDNTLFLINNEVVPFEKLIKLTDIGGDIAKFLSTITYVGTDLIKRIRNESNCNILFDKQSYTIPSFLTKYALEPTLNVQMELDNKILNLDEILKMHNLQTTLSEATEAIPQRRRKMQHQLEKQGDSVEIMYDNKIYSTKEFHKIHPHENDTDFEVIYNNRKLKSPDAMFLLELDTISEPIDNNDISLEDPEFKHVLKHFINQNPPNVSLYYQGVAYTPYTFNLTFGDDIPNGVEVVINNHLVKSNDILELLETMEQSIQPENIVISNVRFQRGIVIHKILKLLSKLNNDDFKVIYNNEKYTPLQFYEEFKANISTNITFWLGNQIIAIDKLVQILDIDKMVYEIITSIDRISPSLLNYLVNKSKTVINHFNKSLLLQKLSSNLRNKFNRKFLMDNERKNLFDLLTLLRLTIDFDELIRGIKDIKKIVAYELGILNPEGVEMNFNNINYMPTQFIDEFQRNIPKDYNITLWRKSIEVPDVIFLYNLGLSDKPFRQRKVDFVGKEIQKGLDQSVINEDDRFFIKLLQQRPNNVYVKFKDVLLKPIQFFKTYGLPKLNKLEYVVDGELVPEEDVIRLSKSDPDNDNFDVTTKYNGNTNEDYPNFFSDLLRKRPKNVYIEYDGEQLTPDQYYLINGDSYINTPRFIVNGQPATKEEVVDLLNQYDEYEAYPIIKMSGGFYTPGDLISLLLQYNPENIKILYSGQIYSPEDLISATQGYIPENLDFLENGSITQPEEIMRKYQLPQYATEEILWPSIEINGKIYGKEDFVKILASFSCDCIKILFDGRAYSPSQFYEIFKENIPNNFEVELFGLTVNRRLVIELIFDAVMNTFEWKNMEDFSSKAETNNRPRKIFNPIEAYNNNFGPFNSEVMGTQPYLPVF